MGNSSGTIVFKGLWEWTCRDKDGKIKFQGRNHNVVVDQGLRWALDRSLLGSAGDSTWFVGLTNSTPTIVAGNSMPTHAGWIEIPFARYTGNRKAWTGVRAGGAEVVSNSASTADFAFVASTTVGGAFLASVSATNSGVMFCASTFTGTDQAVDNLDTINVTYSITAADG